MFLIISMEIVMTDSNVKYGSVVFFDPKKGYGFLKPDDDTANDIFVHFSDVAAEGFKTLYKDQRVSYEVGLNKRGQPKATNVTVLKQ
jgi:CspA family cold shock protein